MTDTKKENETAFSLIRANPQRRCMSIPRFDFPEIPNQTGNWQFIDNCVNIGTTENALCLTDDGTLKVSNTLIVAEQLVLTSGPGLITTTTEDMVLKAITGHKIVVDLLESTSGATFEIKNNSDTIFSVNSQGVIFPSYPSIGDWIFDGKYAGIMGSPHILELNMDSLTVHNTLTSTATMSAPLIKSGDLCFMNNSINQTTGNLDIKVSSGNNLSLNTNKVIVSDTTVNINDLQFNGNMIGSSTISNVITVNSTSISVINQINTTTFRAGNLSITDSSIQQVFTDLQLSVDMDKNIKANISGTGQFGIYNGSTELFSISADGTINPPYPTIGNWIFNNNCATISGSVSNLLCLGISEVIITGTLNVSSNIVGGNNILVGYNGSFIIGGSNGYVMSYDQSISTAKVDIMGGLTTTTTGKVIYELSSTGSYAIVQNGVTKFTVNAIGDIKMNNLRIRDNQIFAPLSSTPLLTLDATKLTVNDTICATNIIVDSITATNVIIDTITINKIMLDELCIDNGQIKQTGSNNLTIETADNQSTIIDLGTMTSNRQFIIESDGTPIFSVASNGTITPPYPVIGDWEFNTNCVGFDGVSNLICLTTTSVDIQPTLNVSNKYQITGTGTDTNINILSGDLITNATTSNSNIDFNLQASTVSNFRINSVNSTNTKLSVSGTGIVQLNDVLINGANIGISGSESVLSLSMDKLTVANDIDASGSITSNTFISGNLLLMDTSINQVMGDLTIQTSDNQNTIVDLGTMTSNRQFIVQNSDGPIFTVASDGTITPMGADIGNWVFTGNVASTTAFGNCIELRAIDVYIPDSKGLTVSGVSIFNNGFISDGGNITVSAGTMKLNNDIPLCFGTTQNFTIKNTNPDTEMTTTSGNIRVNLGDAVDNRAFIISNNATSPPLFAVGADGTITPPYPDIGNWVFSGNTAGISGSTANILTLSQDKLTVATTIEATNIILPSGTLTTTNILGTTITATTATIDKLITDCISPQNTEIQLGNWVFNGNNAGIAGSNTNILSLSANKLTVNTDLLVTNLFVTALELDTVLASISITTLVANITTLNLTNPIPATKVSFDNSNTSITATTVQGAIEELAVVDYSGLTGATAKINTLTDTSQTLKGYVEKYTLLGGDCAVGQPLVTGFNGGIISVTPIGSVPPTFELAGIAGESTLSGNSVNVLRNGFCTARLDTTIPPPTSTSVSLNAVTNNTVQNVSGDIVFTDSGGSSGDYSNNELYNITFVAQPGNTIDIVFNSFMFEDSNSIMYDRLGIQVSSDNITYTNITGVPWLQASATSVPPWSSSFAGSNWDSLGSNNGYILPATEARAITLGAPSFPATISTGFRYVRFYFLSDSSIVDMGWNLTIQTNTPSMLTSLAVGTPLYIDGNDFTKLTINNATQALVGYCAYEDVSNESVYMQVKL